MNAKNPQPELPKRIERLNELANNLWWSWDEDGRQVFRSLDYQLWRNSGQNPVKQLRDISQERIDAAAVDPAFLELYDSAMQKFDRYMSSQGVWCYQYQPGKFEGPIAYFSAEYAIHNSLPIYAGGLGILAGDICKEASDLGLPLVGMGFMYPQGYFRQRISEEGEQQEVYTQLDFAEAPISPCAWPEACGPLIPVQLADRQLYVQVWQVRIGRVNLYLLDTNVAENSTKDQTLSARLYTADQEERIAQLVILGIGGVRALRELRINPAVWHANEDHTAFMILERLREERKKGLSLTSAIEKVRKTTIFTTHTPVQSGHHIFSYQLVDRYLGSYLESAEIDRDTFLKLGNYEGLDAGKFSLTAFALRLSIRSNAVSRLHGGVAQRMWRMIWPTSSKEIPISYITNGVHLPTWQAPEIASLCERQQGTEWIQRQVESEFWNCVVSISDEEFWQLRQKMKDRLLLAIQDRAQKRWLEGSVTTQQVIAMGSLLDPYALTIVFSRRFAEYKRPYLILSDPERLKKIVTNALRPVQIIFAGKSHPADYQSKQLLKTVYQSVMDRGFQGRIAFIEDYDMLLARELVRGADVWLNNPRRLQEACGTSGMKASMNGVINLSVRDGWWDEAYNGYNGWAIDNFQGGNALEEDKNDSEAIYHLLENRIIPLYYARDRKGVPHQWIKIAKEAIRTVSPNYNACRMMREYTERMYRPAIEASKE
jgi:starch phosphorylase